MTSIMGVLNATPDSFYPQSRCMTPDDAVKMSMQMLEHGASVIDVGAESTRPGASFVSEQEEIARLKLVLQALVPKVHACGGKISVDTRKAAVMRLALEHGADIINDISAFTFDPNALEVIASYRPGVVLMHSVGTPQNMQHATSYHNVVEQVASFLQQRYEICKRMGLTDIWVDPGIGFGKTHQHNIDLLRALPRLASIGPVLLGVSRKSLLGHILGRQIQDRLYGSVALAFWAASSGVDMLRVHDVSQTRDVLRVHEALSVDAPGVVRDAVVS